MDHSPLRQRCDLETTAIPVAIRKPSVDDLARRLVIASDAGAVTEAVVRRVVGHGPASLRSRSHPFLRKAVVSGLRNTITPLRTCKITSEEEHNVMNKF